MALLVPVRAGGDKVAFPENYAAGILYGTVDRYDVKQYREQYATPAAVEAVRKGQPIPSGTVLTMIEYKAQLDAQGNPVKDASGHFVKGELGRYVVMEKRTGWGAEYPDTIRNGKWEYQAFTPDRKVSDKVDLNSCFQCHKPHADQDFVISLASFKGVAAGQMAAPPQRGTQHRDRRVVARPSAVSVLPSPVTEESISLACAMASRSSS